MGQADQIYEWMNQEYECFLAYEKETAAILAGTMEDIEEHMRKRTQLQTRIEWLDREIAAACEQDDLLNGEELLAAVKNHCPRGEMNPLLLPFYDLGMSIRVAAMRVQELEPQALDRMSQEKDELLKKIKSVNQGTDAMVSRYYRSTTPKSAETRGNIFKKV